jgi:phage shock protein PspC (stress-responsive transcriptional regulator)
MNTNKELNQFEKLAKLIRQIIIITILFFLLVSGVLVYEVFFNIK